MSVGNRGISHIKIGQYFTANSEATSGGSSLATDLYGKLWVRIDDLRVTNVGYAASLGKSIDEMRNEGRTWSSTSFTDACPVLAVIGFAYESIAHKVPKPGYEQIKWIGKNRDKIAKIVPGERGATVVFTDGSETTITAESAMKYWLRSKVGDKVQE